MAELAYGVAAASGLAEENQRSLRFTERVLERHARADELPLKKLPARHVRGNVTNINTARRARANRHSV